MENKETELISNQHLKSNKINAEPELNFVQITDINNKILFTVMDPLEKSVTLFSNTLQYHISGDDGSHENRGYLQDKRNLERIENVLNAPNYIVQDKKVTGRINYIGLTDITFSDNSTKIKPVVIVAEPSINGYTDFEVVTMLVKGKLSELIDERRMIIYDSNKKLL